MMTVTADDLILIDVGYYMLGCINLEHILDEVGTANIFEMVRLYWWRVVIEDLA